jgi:hypothetical protein
LSERPTLDQTRDQSFKYELFPREDSALWGIAEKAVSAFLENEARNQPRKRVRRENDHDTLVSAAFTIVANLAHFTLFDRCDGSRIILTLGHSRGQGNEPLPPGFGKPLRGLLEGMQWVGALTLAEPTQAGWASTIAPTIAFRTSVEEAGIGEGDFVRRNVQDRIRLSQKTKAGRVFFRIDETPEVAQCRAAVDQINSYLGEADIAFLGNERVDTADRYMARYFNRPVGSTANDNLKLGGRLFGGFWQPMSKSMRRHIRIDGEPVVEIDYGQVLPRLAYAEKGECVPEDEDLYHLPEIDPDGQYRSGIKKAVSAMFYGTKRFSIEIASMLPEGMHLSKFRKVLARRHPALASLIQPGSLIGYALLHRESTMMVAILLSCREQGITALPIHDAVIVPQSAQTMVSRIMRQVANDVAGVSIPVTISS